MAKDYEGFTSEELDGEIRMHLAEIETIKGFKQKLLYRQEAERKEKIQSLIAKRKALDAEIAALETPKARKAAKPVKSSRKGTKLAAKYQSKKNPELTSAGRGELAKWLVEEMAETGLPKEAFLIEK